MHTIIGQWIKKKIYLAGYKSGLDDIERFILALRGNSDEEMGTLLAWANLVRLDLIDTGYLSVDILNFEVSESEHATAQMYLSKWVLQHQKSDSKVYAAGGMVWLHSLRARGYSELRIKGREMWSELYRGFTHVREALFTIEIITEKYHHSFLMKKYTLFQKALSHSFKERVSVCNVSLKKNNMNNPLIKTPGHYKKSS